MRARVLTAVLLTVGLAAGAASAQQVTIACAGAIDPDVAVPEIRKMGFVSIINLRQAGEPGAEIEKEAALGLSNAALRQFAIDYAQSKR